MRVKGTYDDDDEEGKKEEEFVIINIGEEKYEMLETVLQALLAEDFLQKID